MVAKIDSIGNVVNGLVFRVDSLQGNLTQMKIGEGYFTHILYLQLTLFTVIIALIAAVSWSFVIIPFRQKEKQLRIYFEQTLKEHKIELQNYNSDFNTQFNNLKQDLNRTSSQAIRGLYFIQTQRAQSSQGNDKLYFEAAAFIWVMRLSQVCETESMINHCIELANKHIISASIKSALGENFDEIEQIISNLKTKADGEHNDLLTKIEQEYYRQKFA